MAVNVTHSVLLYRIYSERENKNRFSGSFGLSHLGLSLIGGSEPTAFVERNHLYGLVDVI